MKTGQALVTSPLLLTFTILYKIVYHSTKS